MSQETQTVPLPDGTMVSFSATEEPWWTDPNGTGYLDPHLLAPDIDQPRRYMGQARLNELKESVEARGVREAITITPRHLAPWIRVAPEDESCFFAVVSGHRRRFTALNVGLPAVPVRVRIYNSEKDHRLDASLLNSIREELAPLEEGIEMVRLHALGWSKIQLTQAFGWNLNIIQSRMNLTRLAPDIQEMLNPELPENKRLGSTVAGALGGLPSPSYVDLIELYNELWVLYRDQSKIVMPTEELDEEERKFALQRLLLQFVLQKNMGAVRATQFFRDRTFTTRSKASSGEVGRVKRSKRLEMIDTLVRSVTGSPVLDWPHNEFRRAFELKSYEEIAEYAAQLRSACDSLQGLAHILVRINAGKQPTTMEGRLHDEANRIAPSAT